MSIRDKELLSEIEDLMFRIREDIQSLGFNIRHLSEEKKKEIVNRLDNTHYFELDSLSQEMYSRIKELYHIYYMNYRRGEIKPGLNVLGIGDKSVVLRLDNKEYNDIEFKWEEIEKLLEIMRKKKSIEKLIITKKENHVSISLDVKDLEEILKYKKFEYFTETVTSKIGED